MLQLSTACKYYWFDAHTDMRKSFDGLSGIILQCMGATAQADSIFIFINKKHNQIKLLLWEGDGFALYHKRLEKGTYDKPQMSPENHYNISAAQLQLILQGVQLKTVRYKKRFSFSPK